MLSLVVEWYLVVEKKKRGNQARVQMYTQHWREEEEGLWMMVVLMMWLLLLMRLQLQLMRRCRRLQCQGQRRRPPVSGLLHVCIQDMCLTNMQCTTH